MRKPQKPSPLTLRESGKTLSFWSAWFAVLFLVSLFGIDAYTHEPCTRAISRQFSFPDCYIPDLNPGLLLSEASFLMSHDAATGYLKPNYGLSSATNLYAKNQIGSVYQQLQDGARALDVRPKLLQNGTVLCHHGAITIPVTLYELVVDAKRWASENPDELVLILHLNLAYESGLTPSADTAVEALSEVYDALGVAYAACEDVYGLTVRETMELAGLPNGAGYLLALDHHDAYATSCAKMNYVEERIVTCYPNNHTIPCTKPNSPALQDLKDYTLASANNEATDSTYELGPPASLDYYPFNTIQGLWQVDTHSAALGVAHVSSIIDDNTKSQLNARIVDWVYGGEFDSISLLMVDHVQLNGNALLSVLRNSCGGQSRLANSIGDDDGTSNYVENNELCGASLRKPKLNQKHMSTLFFYFTFSIYGIFALWLMIMLRHYHKYYNQDQQVTLRMQEDLKAAEDQFQRVMAGEFT